MGQTTPVGSVRMGWVCMLFAMEERGLYFTSRLIRCAPVRLPLDQSQGNYPDQKVVTVGDFRIGLCHGHQIVPWGDRDVIAMHQRALGVDIMITGATQKVRATTHRNALFTWHPLRALLHLRSGLRWVRVMAPMTCLVWFVSLLVLASRPCTIISLSHPPFCRPW